MVDPNSARATHLILDGPWGVFLVGCVGGIVVEIGLLHKTKYQRPPDYLSSVYFWCVVSVMALTGGGLACFYGWPQEALLVLNIGASAPYFLQSLASATPRLARRTRGGGRRPRVG